MIAMPARFLPCVLLSLVLVAGDASAWTRGGPGDCQDLSAVAPFTQFRYEAQMQTIWDTLQDPKDPSSSCTGCHPGNFGAGGLGLGAGFSYGTLFNVPSAQEPSILRIDPGNAANSLLFQKLNCDQPVVGGRMPPTSTLSAAQQALVRDWINHGAPLSRLGFEDR